MHIASNPCSDPSRGLAFMQGYAVKAGMLCARGELLLMADADGATVAAEEQRLEEALQKVKVSPRSRS